MAPVAFQKKVWWKEEARDWSLFEAPLLCPCLALLDQLHPISSELWLAATAAQL